MQRGPKSVTWLLKHSQWLNSWWIVWSTQWQQQKFIHPAPARGPSRFCPHRKGRRQSSGPEESLWSLSRSTRDQRDSRVCNILGVWCSNGLRYVTDVINLLFLCYWCDKFVVLQKEWCPIDTEVQTHYPPSQTRLGTNTVNPLSPPPEESLTWQFAVGLAGVSRRRHRQSPGGILWGRGGPPRLHNAARASSTSCLWNKWNKR